MNDIDDAELQAAIQELEKRPLVRFAMDPIAVFTLVAQVQLALKHPNNHGPGAKAARAWAEAAAVALNLPPVLQAVLEDGWERPADPLPLFPARTRRVH